MQSQEKDVQRDRHTGSISNTAAWPQPMCEASSLIRNEIEPYSFLSSRCAPMSVSLALALRVFAPPATGPSRPGRRDWERSCRWRHRSSTGARRKAGGFRADSRLRMVRGRRRARRILRRLDGTHANVGVGCIIIVGMGAGSVLCLRRSRRCRGPRASAAAVAAAICGRVRRRVSVSFRSLILRSQVFQA